MSRLLAACLSGLALAAIAPAVTSAQPEYPHLKPGLWDDKMNTSGISMGVQMCMDESVASRAAAFRPPTPGGAPADSDCSKREMKPIPGGFQMDATCTVRGRTTRTSMVMTGNFDSDYKMDMTVTPDSGREVKISMAARWAGPCPASMKPGQVVTKMDMGGIAAAMAAAQAAGR
jgi:hypothetical protein